MPTMAELTAPLRSVPIGVTREPPRLSCMVPFFPQLVKVFDVAATQALAEKQPGEDEMEELEWWQLKAERVQENIRASTDGVAAVAAQFLSGSDLPAAELWSRYLDHFVARLYPCTATAEIPLQHQVLRAWLAAKLAEFDPLGDRRVASLHVIAQYEAHETLLSVLAASIDPLADLAPAETTSRSIIDVIESASFSDVTNQLNAAMVRPFYDLMIQIEGEAVASIVPRLLRWAEAFEKAKLDTIPANAHGIDFKQIDAMRVMQAVVQSNAVADQHISTVITRLRDLVGGSSTPRLRLADVWRMLEQHGELMANAAFCSRLSAGWLRSSPETETDDMRCLLVSVCSTATLTTPQRTPLLESLLLGHKPQKLQKLIKAIQSPEGNLVAWLEALQGETGGMRVTELLEAQLKIEAASNSAGKGQPPWFPGADDQQATKSQPLTKAYFQVVWKWMLLRHANDGLSELAFLAQQLQSARNLAAVPIQRALALSAVRVLLIDQVATRIAADQEGSLLHDGDEADRFMGQLEMMTDDSDITPFWAGELALAVCTMLNDNARGQRLLETRAVSEEKVNQTMAAWLHDAVKITGQDSPIDAAAFQTQRPPLVLQLQPALLASQAYRVESAESSFARELVSRREQLRLLWVLPDLLEFYQYITNQLSDHPQEEAHWQKMTVGALLDLLSRANLEDGEYHRQLWVRVKVGVNMFWAAESSAGPTRLDENLRVWSILSTAADAHGAMPPELPADCLFKPLAQMLRALQDFLQHAAVNTPLLKPDQRVRHPETGEHFLDGLAEMNVYKMQEVLPLVEGEGLTEQVERLTAEVKLRSEHLDAIGPLAHAVASHCSWSADRLQPLTDRHSFSLAAIGAELNGLKNSLRQYGPPQRYRKICRFKDSTSQHQHQSTYHFQVYHSLGYDSLRELTSALQPIIEFAEASGQQQGTVRELLMEMYPGAAEDDYLTRAYVDLEEEEQRHDFLGTPASELSELCRFLRGQLDSEAYRFAREDKELKRVWSADVDAALDTLAARRKDLAAEASRLHAILVKYRRFIAAAPETPMCTSLAKGFTSESALLKEVPLLRDLKEMPLLPDSWLIGAHYVQLRRQLEAWAKTAPAAAPVTPWTWPFFFSHGATGAPVPDGEDALRIRMTPWFLLDPPEVEAARREREDQERMEALMQVEAERSSAAPEAMSPVPQPLAADEFASPITEEGPKGAPDTGGKGSKTGKGGKGGRGGKGGKGGRGRGSSISLGQLAAAEVHEVQQQQDAQEAVRTQLRSLCTHEEPLPESLVDELKVELQNAKNAGVPDSDPVVQQAMEVREGTVREREQTLAALVTAHRARPLDDAALRGVLARARAVGLPHDDSEIEEATRLLRKATMAQETLRSCLASSFPSEAALSNAMTAVRDLQLADPRVAQASRLLRELQAEQMHFEGEAKQRWGGEAAAKLKASSAAWQARSATSTGWPAGVPARKAAETMLTNLAKSTDRKSVDAAISSLEKDPNLKSWVHKQAYLAVANTCSSHFDLYRDDAQDDLDAYAEAAAAAEGGSTFVPAFLLAAARLCSPSDTLFRAECLRRCCVQETQALLTADEQRIAKLPLGAAAEPLAADTSAGGGIETPLSRWTKMKSEPDAIACPSLDKLMAMVGLQTVKQEALELYVRVKVEKALPAERRVPQSLNFALLGNPGTGKTTVARHLGGILNELGVRSNDKFIGTTGEKLARMGADKVSKQIDDAMGGVLFIDEAYGLEPARNADAAAVAMQLLDVAEEKRTELTIILAGYKDDMETKLFEFNDGFDRRFNYQITFEDYTEAELAQIFAQMCADHKWPPADGEEVVAVAARRLARGRGRRGFGNAGEVRKLFEAAYRRALDRDANAQALTIVDVIGPPPDRAHVPELSAALDKLDEMIGLEAVKQAIESLVTLAQTNYQRELEGQPPYPVPLNRVFLGNPGTGKTTVAKLYGRILKAVGLLSDGKCELKQPSDLTGSHVGKTQERTSALVKRCMGKVLIIDEAYALNGSSYGHDAIDTLIGLVHGAPGEDIAVVLIGYEKQMRKMFREANPGLTRRFGLKDAFQFDDFDDAELDRIVQSGLREAGLKAPRDVRAKVIKALGAQRTRPNFGNAGDAVDMVARAKERLVSRDPRATTLTLADFGLDRVSGDGLSALEGLFKVDHIRSRLQELRATLEQCDRDGKDRAEYLESYVFLGSPGTGKTTIARVMAQILHDLGVLGSTNVKIVSGLDMQAGFVGQTKDKVNELMAEAQGGVLFIDEAYTLGQGHYSSEAVDQLVALMTSPEHLNKTVVILAGYKEQMERMLGSNDGLRSRVTGRIEFPDWDAEDVVNAVRQKCEREAIRLTDEAAQVLSSELREIQARPSWANARDCVTSCRLLYKARAQRCANAGEAEPSYVEQDATTAMAALRETRPLGDVIPVMAAAQAAAAAIAAAASAFRPVPQMGNFVGGVPGALAGAPPPQIEAEDELRCVDITDEEEAEQQAAPPEADIDPVYAALLKACVAEGYDASHERRQELVAVLEAGADLPANIMGRVVEATGLSEARAQEMLKPQVHRVLEAMRAAVQQEEARREEERRLEEEQRLEELRRKQEEHRRVQEALQRCRACPMGFSWYQCGGGWRCTGGSHFMSDAQLGHWNA